MLPSCQNRQLNILSLFSDLQYIYSIEAGSLPVFLLVQPPADTVQWNSSTSPWTRPDPRVNPSGTRGRDAVRSSHRTSCASPGTYSAAATPWAPSLRSCSSCDYAPGSLSPPVWVSVAGSARGSPLPAPYDWRTAPSGSCDAAGGWWWSTSSGSSCRWCTDTGGASRSGNRWRPPRGSWRGVGCRGWWRSADRRPTRSRTGLRCLPGTDAAPWRTCGPR